MGEATSSSSRRMERGDHGGQQRQVVTGTAAANKQERSEQLDNFLLRRPSAAEVVDKGTIPRSVIDEGKASWQVPDRKPSSSGVIAKRSRASKKRKEMYVGRFSSQRIHKVRDPVSIVDEAMAPRKQHQAGQQGQNNRRPHGEDRSRTFALQPPEAEGKAGSQETRAPPAVFPQHDHRGKTQERRPRGAAGSQPENDETEGEIHQGAQERDRAQAQDEQEQVPA